MVNYSLNTDARRDINFLMAASSIAIILLLNIFLIDIGVEISVASSFSTYLFLNWIFDNHVWKWKIIRSYHGVPDLNGFWNCTVQRISSEPDLLGKYQTEEFHLSAVISQTFSRISVEVSNQNGFSTITSASFDLSNSLKPCLRYSYSIKPFGGTKKGNIRGEGLQELYILDSETIEGPYFSTKAREGRLHLTRA